MLYETERLESTEKLDYWSQIWALKKGALTARREKIENIIE